MKKKYTFLIFFILIFSQRAMSQVAVNNFQQVDSFAISVHYKKDVIALTNELTVPYTSELFKARAIFKWITENIAYDYKYFNEYAYKGKEQPGFECKGKDCKKERSEWEWNYIKKVVENKKAVCMGYALLFKKMCELAGLQSEIIPGYVRTEHYQVGTPGTLDHAWNAVRIDSFYYLLDATWAAGSCSKNEDGKLLSYRKNYKEYYWLTKPEDYARDHFPKDTQWLLLSNYDKAKFAANPYYASNILSKIKLINPQSGILTAKKGDTLHFGITYNGDLKNLQINSNVFRNPDVWTIEETGKRKVKRLDTIALKRQQYIPYKTRGNVHEFEYVVTDNSLYYLDIMIDRQRVMRFKVVIDNNNRTAGN